MSPQKRKPTNPYYNPDGQKRTTQDPAKQVKRRAAYEKYKQKAKKQKYITIGLFAFVLILVAAWFITRWLSPSNDESTSASQPITSASASSSESPSENSSIPNGGYTIDTTEWNLILVNKTSPLPSGYTVDTVPIGNGYEFDARAADALTQMLADGNAEGLNLMVCSAYRSVARQEVLYNNKVNEYIGYGYSEEEARQIAGTIVAPPGTSEHATGLAADIVSVNYQVLDEGFENTPEFAWLQEHAADYGFVLRFPSNKQDVTDIIYEPWHYRYVGVEHAHRMNELGLCLEEYVALSENTN